MKDFSGYKDKIYKIIGAAMEVHAELGGGLLEAVYNEALCMELKKRGINAESEKELHCFYKGEMMTKEYRMDIVVDDIILELKSVSEIIPVHRAQLFNYLRLTQKPVGMIINFGAWSLQGERYVYDIDDRRCYLVDKAIERVFTDDDWWYDNE